MLFDESSFIICLLRITIISKESIFVTNFLGILDFVTEISWQLVTFLPHSSSFPFQVSSAAPLSQIERISCSTEDVCIVIAKEECLSNLSLTGQQAADHILNRISYRHQFMRTPDEVR